MPQLAREVFVYSAQNRHYRSGGGPTVIALTRRQVPVPRGVKSTNNWSHYNAQRDKVSAIIALAGVNRSTTLVRSLCEVAHKSPKCYENCAYAVGHDLRMTLRTTLVSLVRSRVVAQLERWSCPTLDSLVPEFSEKPCNSQDVIFRGWSCSAFPEQLRENTVVF